MKHFLHLCICCGLLLITSALHAQATLPTQFTGASSEWLTFDGLQRPTGRLLSQVSAVQASGMMTKVTLHQQLFDASDIPLLDYDLPARVATGGPVRLDVRAFLSAHLLRALQVNGLVLEVDSLATLPTASARPGDLLPETHLVAGNGGGPSPRGVEIASVGRWIDDRETLTTPAGTFVCLRLNQNLRINTFTAGARRTYEARVVAWYAPETGLVKLATYVGSKLLDTTVLNRLLPLSGAATVSTASQ